MSKKVMENDPDYTLMPAKAGGHYAG